MLNQGQYELPVYTLPLIGLFVFQCLSHRVRMLFKALRFLICQKGDANTNAEGNDAQMKAKDRLKIGDIERRNNKALVCTSDDKLVLLEASHSLSHWASANAGRLGNRLLRHRHSRRELSA